MKLKHHIATGHKHLLSLQRIQRDIALGIQAEPSGAEDGGDGQGNTRNVRCTGAKDAALNLGQAVRHIRLPVHNAQRRQHHRPAWKDEGQKGKKNPKMIKKRGKEKKRGGKEEEEGGRKTKKNKKKKKKREGEEVEQQQQMEREE